MKRQEMHSKETKQSSKVDIAVTHVGTVSQVILNNWELHVSGSSGKSGQHEINQVINFSRDRYENYINKLNGNSRNLKHSYKDGECL